VPNTFKIKYSYNLSSNHIDSHKRGIWHSKSSMINRFKKIVSELSSFNYSTVLDVGCGDASLFEYLFKRNSSINYYGIDISNKIINVAKKKNYKLEKKLICSDIKKFSSNIKFDLVVCIGVVQFTNISFDDLLNEIKKKLFSYSRVIIDGKLKNYDKDGACLDENYIKKISKKNNFIIDQFFYHNADKSDFSKKKKYNNFMIFLKNDN
jgi:cyclopropane fatty-acyl-phospholipid synthase-like methyltransferase